MATQGTAVASANTRTDPQNEWAVCEGTAQMHNMFGVDVNDNNGQDDLIRITNNANNNNNDRN